MILPFNQKRLVFISGMSGAGISTSLGVFRDMGYDVFDNLPLFLVPDLLSKTADTKAIAIGLDSKTKGYTAEGFGALIAQIRQGKKHRIDAIFLDCDDNVIERRYVQTKRRHPLAEKDHSVREAIMTERRLTEELMPLMDNRIDTTQYSVYDLRNVLERQYDIEERRDIQITLMSFGYKYGMPNHADRVEDVRFLNNPYWEEALRDLSGLDLKIQQYISKDKNFSRYIKKSKDFLKFLLPLYKAEGKNHLLLAFGCTGGRHRSVYTVETVAAYIRSLGYSVAIQHRDKDHKNG
jgi:UPF0042 nucleotide-binding protein